jgi:hypothetical protein
MPLLLTWLGVVAWLLEVFFLAEILESRGKQVIPVAIEIALYRTKLLLFNKLL